MPAVTFSPIGNGVSFLGLSLVLLNGGFINTYQAGTTTPLATYTTNAGNVANSNPIVLQSDGRAPQEIWLIQGSAYKFVVSDALSNVIATYDNILGIDGALRADLASTSNTDLGVSLVGGAERVVDSIAALKAISKLTNSRVYVTGIITPGDGFGGHYYYDASDTTSANDDYSIVVAADGARWKIIQSNGYKYGNRTPVAGTSMKIDYLLENNTVTPLKNLGGIWPGSTYTYHGISKAFGSGDGSANAPCTALFALAINNGSSSDVVAGLDVATAHANSGSKSVFGRNIIAGADTGVLSAKMVGLEIDIEPSVGATSAGTGGAIFVNGFSVNNLGAVMQSGGTPGATFNNGILIGNIASAGAAFAALPGLSCGTGLDLTQGTYATAAISVGPAQRINHYGNGVNIAASHFSDTGDNFNTALKTQWIINAGTNTENTTFFVARDLAGTAVSLSVKVATGTAPNGAAAVVYANANSSTSRSINAGGTINASGADYAEYEVKSSGCGIVTKGQIVGFNTEGELTDKWSESISFGIKSTNPNLVGGDDWHKGVGPEPIAPLPPYEPKNKPERLNTNRLMPDEIEEIYIIQLAEWQMTVDAYQAALPAYEAAFSKYLDDKEKYNSQLEDARSKVDRIAYCGKAPVNILGAQIGDYIVPIDDNGVISAMPINNPSFEQYRLSVGRVRRILEDGRAEICVKPI